MRLFVTTQLWSAEQLQ